MTRRRLGLIVLLAAAIGFAWWARSRTPRPEPTASLRIDSGPPATGFERAIAPRDFVFPRDHGPHFDFQTEWWYYTGNLQGDDGQRFGFQLTFFRRGLTPGLIERASALGTNQIYFAHFAVTDVAAGTHRFAERFSRGAAGLAEARGDPYGVWLEDWRVESLDAEGRAVRLVAEEGGAGIDLVLRAVKPIVAHGDGGLSPKGDAPGNASYYLSHTRMRAEGRVTVDGEAVPVRGEAWFDHEWSTSALGPRAVGWDWFSLQLSDGRELMFFQIRRDDGAIEPASSGTLVEPDGRTVRLSADEVTIEVTRTWVSPDTGGEYPARWRVAVPSRAIDVLVTPRLAGQEMRVSLVYWEGAVQVEGESRGAPVTGAGYVELTGYVRSMQGEF